MNAYWFYYTQLKRQNAKVIDTLGNSRDFLLL